MFLNFVSVYRLNTFHSYYSSKVYHISYYVFYGISNNFLNVLKGFRRINHAVTILLHNDIATKYGFCLLFADEGIELEGTLCFIF